MICRASLYYLECTLSTDFLAALIVLSHLLKIEIYSHGSSDPLKPRAQTLTEPNGQVFLFLFTLPPQINILDWGCVQSLVPPVFYPPSKVFPLLDTRTAHHGRCCTRGRRSPLLPPHTLHSNALQRLHHLEGAPDPFPSEAISSTVYRPQNLAPVDPDSQDLEAFPSLAPSPVNVSRPVAPAWGAPTGPRLAAHVPQVTESFTLSAIDLSSAGKDGRPATLGEIMKQVMANYKIRIEASTNQKTRQTTFHLKADSRKELEKGKRSLLASLSPLVRCPLFASVPRVTI